MFALSGEEPWSRISALFTPPTALKDDLGTYRSVMTFADGRAVRTAEDWARRREEILKGWHEVLGPWPPLLEKPGIEYLDKEQVENFTRHKVEIEVAPDRVSTAYLLIPDGKGPFPAVVDVFYYPEDGAGLDPKKRLQNDFGYQAARCGIAALCVGQNPTEPKEGAVLYYPAWDRAQLQPLSYLAYVAANTHALLSSLPAIDGRRIGVVGHSYGGKWAMFAACLWEKFVCGAVSDPGIVFDEKRPNVNYWEPWYLGYEAGKPARRQGVVTPENPRTGPYKALYEGGRDLHELHVLMAPRPFFVAGGSEDPPERWKALNHLATVNRLLGHEGRVGMSNRTVHEISPEASEQIRCFFEHFLKR
jgi:dienelactone hydrolase